MPNLAVFSTSVEVFLVVIPKPRLLDSLLHVRGGVSKEREFGQRTIESSPRPWRCFHRGARARLACGGLLHVRGGVSRICVRVGASKKSSPRPWRCFRDGKLICWQIYVFSTSVEVFLAARLRNRCSRGLLLVRGGVSTTGLLCTTEQTSSPRPWRCFCGQEKD